jgi:hypothetical protein
MMGMIKKTREEDVFMDYGSLISKLYPEIKSNKSICSFKTYLNKFQYKYTRVKIKKEFLINKKIKFYFKQKKIFK